MGATPVSGRPFGRTSLGLPPLLRLSEERNVRQYWFGNPSKRRLDKAEAGRTCAEDNCKTILSRYNMTDRCGVHPPTLTVPAVRNSK